MQCHFAHNIAWRLSSCFCHFPNLLSQAVLQGRSMTSLFDRISVRELLPSADAKFRYLENIPERKVTHFHRKSRSNLRYTCYVRLKCETSLRCTATSISTPLITTAGNRGGVLEDTF